MRNLLAVFLVSFGLLTACEGSPAMVSDGGVAGDAAIERIYGYTEWRVRCPYDATDCIDYPDRFVDGFDGEDGIRATCEHYDNGLGGFPRVRWHLERTHPETGETFSLAFDGEIATLWTGSHIESFGIGTLIVRDGADTFTARVGRDPQSAAQPCQAREWQSGPDDEGRPLLHGLILCNDVDGFNVTAAGGVAVEAPFSFNIYDCAGYQRD